MADPQHVPVLDGFDRFTVKLYRGGLILAALGIAATSTVDIAAAATSIPVEPLTTAAWGLLSVGTALAVLNMHLYDKRVRWFIAASCWTGLLLLLAGGQELPGAKILAHAGLGFVFVTLSGFAMKEQFCFRIPGLRLVPLFLALSLAPMLFEIPALGGLILAPAAVLYFILTMAKLRMPLHFDVGDKSRYQI